MYTKIKQYFLPSLLLLVLIYTRFVNLGWGLPYPLHPDEMNMAIAVQNLHCSNFSLFHFQLSALKECFNPHFFAYGQPPLYLAYILILVEKMFSISNTGIRMEEAIVVLRVISATASIVTFFILIQIIILLTDVKSKIKIQKSKTQSKIKNFLLLVSDQRLLIASLLFILSPVLIQFAHFGTTESLLMFLATGLVYICLKILVSPKLETRTVIWAATITGAAVAIKVSAAAYVLLPVLAIGLRLWTVRKPSPVVFFRLLIGAILAGTAVFTALSPQTILSFSEFANSMRYESGVATGVIPVFYTQQFEFSRPFIFQFLQIFPYALGWPVLVLALCGFLLLPNNRRNNFLRLAFLVLFVPNAFLYAKWTRFIAPAYPLMIVLAAVFVSYLFQHIHSFIRSKKVNSRFLLLTSHILLPIVIILAAAPGAAYLSIYTHEDVRFQTSRWIQQHIPPGSNLFEESGNVVDLPVSLPVTHAAMPDTSNTYRKSAFNFYEVDASPNLQEQLRTDLAQTDYIIVPSRRVFMNYTCIKDVQNSLRQNSGQAEFRILNSIAYDYKRCQQLALHYPVVSNYYNELFTGRLGFSPVATITSFPKITLFGKTVISFPDEQAEETWSVFDHPVVRIYKKTDSH